VLKEYAAEMISNTFDDHNQGGQPVQRATWNPQGGSKQCSTYCEKALLASVQIF